MNNQTFIVTNPLLKTVEESESIVAQMWEVTEVLESAIADERTWHGRYKDALDNYEIAETEELAEVIIMAQQKEGPLAGIAVSGKGYDIVLTNLKNQLRKGALAHLWKSADQTRRNYEMAQIELEQAQARFAALRKVIDLKANILRAATI